VIDNFSILLSHGLLAWALWVLVNRPDVDDEAPPVPDAEPQGFTAQKPSPSRKAKRDA
jgi:hypothetical protein